jgi:hypothetical protein
VKWMSYCLQSVKLVKKQRQPGASGSHLWSQTTEIRRIIIQSQPRQDPILKKSVTKLRSGRVAQGVSPKFKPQYHKKKRERKKENSLSTGSKLKDTKRHITSNLWSWTRSLPLKILLGSLSYRSALYSGIYQEKLKCMLMLHYHKRENIEALN